MTKPRTCRSARSLMRISALSVLGCAVLAGTSWAQGSNSAGATFASMDRAALETQQRESAELLVARTEAASGRRFDPTYRQWLVGAVSAQTRERVQELLSAGDEGDPILNALGSSAADLVYTPVTPCRLFDTRSSSAGILVGNTQRNFVVAGTAGFPAQGGLSGGCGVPYGPATSVMINFAAVTPTGTGNIRAWAVASPQPAAPVAATMNFSPTLVALANGVAVPICNPAVTSCTLGDLRLQADANSVHVVGDVVGYFRKVDMPIGAENLGAETLVAGLSYFFGTTQFTPLQDVSCLVTCTSDVTSSGANTTGTFALKTAFKNVTAGTNTQGGWFNSAARTDSTANGGSSASQTGVWNLTGGMTSQFGCYVTVSGDWVGDTANPSVAWLCR